MDLTLDIETFSRADLKKAGLAAYAQHKSTDILCACWAFGDGLVRAWVPTADEQFAIDMMRTARALLHRSGDAVRARRSDQARR